MSEAEPSIVALPPAVPGVTYDMQCGSKFSSLDFDYQAFYNLAKKYDIDNDSINAYSIHFTAEYDENAYARYTASDHRSKIYNMTCLIINESVYAQEYEKGSKEHTDVNEFVNDIFGQKITELTLHETGHWVEHVRNGIGHQTFINRRINKRGLASLSFAGTTALAAEGADVRTLPIPIVAGAILYAGYLARWHRLYGHDLRTDPKERFAYGFAEENKDFMLVTTAFAPGAQRMEGLT